MFSTFHVDPYHSAASRLPSDLAVGEAASYVVDHMMGDGMSVIDPGTPIWTVETAEALRRAVEDDSATTGKSVWETLNLQLTDQPREVILLAAEIVFLRDLPNRSITATKKLEDVTRILSCLRTPVSLPDEMRRSLGVEKGSFAGGVGYNQPAVETDFPGLPDLLAAGPRFPKVARTQRAAILGNFTKL